MIWVTIKSEFICPILDQKMVPTEGMPIPRGEGKHGTCFKIPSWKNNRYNNIKKKKKKVFTTLKLSDAGILALFQLAYP